MLIPFAMLGAFQTIRDELPPSWQEKLHLLNILPNWSWQTWVIIPLVIVVFIVLESAYRELLHNQEQILLEQHLTNHEHKNFSIVWVNGESWLRTSGQNKQYWEDESDGLSLLLKGYVSVTTIGTIRVESVTLDMGGQSYSCNWTSEGFYTSEERDVEFEIPLNTPRGKRSATLKAIVDGQPYISESFMLDLPNGKQVFRMQG